MTDIVARLRQTRADMLGTDDEQHYWDCHDSADEIERLHLAIRRLADQDATLSVVGGNVIVEVECQDSSQGNCILTDEERADLQMWAAECLRQCSNATDGNDWDAAERWSARAARAAKILERLR